jgi:hypothetical protein
VHPRARHGSNSRLRGSEAATAAASTAPTESARCLGLGAGRPALGVEAQHSPPRRVRKYRVAPRTQLIRDTVHRSRGSVLCAGGAAAAGSRADRRRTVAEANTSSHGRPQDLQGRVPGHCRRHSAVRTPRRPVTASSRRGADHAVTPADVPRSPVHPALTAAPRRPARRRAPSRCLRAGLRRQLREHRGDHVGHRLLRQVQAAGDVSLAHPTGDEVEELVLPLGRLR